MANTNLTTLFGSIADALREKGGTSDKIKASDFPTAIENLPSGGGSEVEEYEISFESDHQGVTIPTELSIDEIERVTCNFSGTVTRSSTYYIIEYDLHTPQYFVANPTESLPFCGGYEVAVAWQGTWGGGQIRSASLSDLATESEDGIFIDIQTSQLNSSFCGNGNCSYIFKVYPKED